MLKAERGSLRSRGAATVSSLTLRQISAAIPAERAWGVWLSRQIIARVMDTFGPSLTGAHAEQVDVAHPACAVLLSPAKDLTFTLAKTQEQLRRDPAMREIAAFIAESVRANTIDQAAG